MQLQEATKKVNLAAWFSCALKNKGLEMLTFLGRNDSDWSMFAVGSPGFEVEPIRMKN